MDGRRFRCVVTDAGGNEIVSGEAVLTVLSPAATGDSGVPVAGSVTVPALLCILLPGRRRRKTVQR